MIKLLAVDMDGTCLNSKGEMSDNTLSALKKAAEIGVIVVPTTGRNANCLPVKIKNESFYRYVISSNGSLVIDLKENKKLFSAPLDNDVAGEIADACKKHRVLVGAHIDRDFYTQGLILYFGVKHVLGSDAPVVKRVRDMAKTVRENGRHIEEFQLFYKGEKYRDIVKEIIAPYPEVCSAHSKGYAEIYNKAGSKGTALLALGEILGITPDEIACFGDEENDISMFECVSHRFAMGNAREEIKKRATVILPSNDEDGVAFAIEKYILNTAEQRS